jgi:hypothetical protein
MSEIRYSKSGTPFIHLVDAEGKTYGDFIFSAMTATKAGYKYLCFSHRHSQSVNESYVFNLKLKRDTAGKKGVPHGMLPTPLIKWFRKLFAQVQVDGVIPFSAINEMEPLIADLDIDLVIRMDKRKKS